MKKSHCYQSALVLSLAVISVLFSCRKESLEPYKNPELPIEERVKDLVSRMTQEEKFWQMFMIPGDLSEGKEQYKHGIFGFQVAAKGKQAEAAGQLLEYGPSGTAFEVTEKINAIQKYFIEETRLGIPIIPFDEALHGLVRDGATAFPQAIALAATWDTVTVGNVGRAIARETKTRGIRQILSPVLNIARDVRWGRVEETYGEDPYLTTQTGLAFISQFENAGVVTTPKHFVSNVGDGGRDSYPIHHNERLMEEVYFPAFKAVVQKAGARSLMTAYNSYDGTPCTSNDYLLNQKLKEQWGFHGFVISDAGATGGANVLHFTAADYAESTKHAIEGGLDVIFQTSYDHYPLFWEAFEKGMIDEKAIDEAVSRVLRIKFELGLFEDPYVNPEEAAKWNGHATHRQVAREAAAKSMVLLKNEKEVLPLSKAIRKVALIGQDASEARLGGYSGPGNQPVSMLKGVKEALGGDKVLYAKGCDRQAVTYATIDQRYLQTTIDGEKKNGLKGVYFDNITLEGEPVVTRVDANMDFRWTLFSPHADLPYDWYSVRWTGQLVAPVTGKVNIGVEGNDGYRLYVNDELVIDNWKKQSFGHRLAALALRKGQKYDIRLEYFEATGNAKFRLVWDYGVANTWKKEIAEAVAVARKSEVAVVVAGIDEGEFQDRALLNLPGHQEALIKAVAATGKPTVVVLVGGSAITMNNWLDEVESVVMAWYPGEAGGYALADILFGDKNPAGRLPITFPLHEAQLPLYYNHKPTGRGDDYINLSGQPLFPFGYGLSYTSFEYSDIRLDKSTIKPGESTVVRCKVYNSGARAGDEVVQLYLRDELASVVRPVMELKGFRRISLEAGEEADIAFPLSFEELKMLDKDMNWIVEPGAFRIMIGASSKDIRLRTRLQVVE
ncbi:beta-glucosidase [Marinilabiliaceae bacterium JC017]|nr:beta-glucosidase [Marinilabiliaceae bacterium JC017]